MTSFFKRNIPSLPVLKLFMFSALVWAAVVGPISAVLILVNVGATSPQIGVVTALCAVMAMVFAPVFGLISDKLGSPRLVLSCCLFAAAVFFGMVLFTQNFYTVATLLILEAVFRSGIVALLDSHIISETKAIPGLQYSHIRLSGSLSFGGISLFYSFVINEGGILAIVPISLAIAAAAVIWGLSVAKGRWEAKKDPGHVVRRAKSNIKKDAASLLKNKAFVMLVLFSGLSALSIMPMFVFLIEFVNVLGGSPGQVPFIHAMRCVVEIPVFIYIGTKCKNTAPKKLLSIGAALTVMYTVGIFFANSFLVLLLSHALMGAPGFILMLTGRLRYLNLVTPEAVRSTSITLMGTGEIAIGSIIGNLLAGFVIWNFGTAHLALFSFGMVSLAVVLLVFMPSKQ